MEIDYNLKNLSQTFQVVPHVFKKSKLIAVVLFLSGNLSSIFPLMFKDDVIVG